MSSGRQSRGTDARRALHRGDDGDRLGLAPLDHQPQGRLGQDEMDRKRIEDRYAAQKIATRHPNTGTTNTANTPARIWPRIMNAMPSATNSPRTLVGAYSELMVLAMGMQAPRPAPVNTRHTANIPYPVEKNVTTLNSRVEHRAADQGLLPPHVVGHDAGKRPAL